MRKCHRALGLCLSPAFALWAVCGGLLLLRKTGLYERRGGFRDAIQHLHDLEIIAPYVGLVPAVGLLIVVVTGWLLWVQAHRRTRTRVHSPELPANPGIEPDANRPGQQ